MEEEKVLEPIIFTHEEFGTVRMLGDWDNPEFCLADLCRYLELDASQVMKRLDGGVVSIHPISDSLGRTQKANFVNEDGLYDVILDSRKPSAKKFHKWIISEVLPAMRQTFTSDAEEPMKPLLFTHEEFGTVRTLGDWDNPEFCLADLCKSLDLRVDGVVARLKDDPITAGVISQHPIPDALGRIQNTYFVNEDGLYDVILDSRKPSAKKFRKWITSEVLPALRKTGSYTMPGNDDAKTVNIYFGGFGNMSEDSSEKWLKEKSGENLVRLAKLLGSKDLTADQEYVLKKAFWFLTGEQFPVQKEKQQE